ncbi:flagellar biosynthesis protein FlhB [Helicobacter sp. 16-1353]|uniref:flagellar biosynthesis protein FlhB n=1 Tax=Helicobacter sp. 16-1353 TaxID=2004996 RepID=UPI000DCB781C|nr:flagellar biosynthesis protein FlhB [Helicobacter sp. 16-1353]RAX55137.1 flagellar biosynthesis protein FlhB [Helicobacter sp. 16-1353]
MAQTDEKTELPSEYKKQKAREEGNVGKSQEVTGFLALFVGFGIIFLLLPYLGRKIENLFVYAMNFNLNDFNDTGALNLAIFIITESIIIVAPIFLALLVAGIAGNILQFGFLITIKTIIPKFSKINIITGLKNVISLRKLLDGFLITLKVSIALSLGFFIFAGFLKELPNIAFLNIFYQLIWLKDKALILGSILLILFFFMAALDFYIRRRQYITNLKMTKQEVKDEYKQLQGNPQIRARIRQTMRKMSSRKMLSNVAKATVVITNPTHYAVAIKFVLNEDIAPIVLAKGTDLLAIRIKEIAREHNIPIREHPQLARELYRLTEIDQYIPQELFRAVAKVLQTTEEIASQFQ